VSHRDVQQGSSIRIRWWCIEVKRKFAAPAQELWDLLTDTQKWPQWGPSVVAVQSPERYIKLHTTGKVLTLLGWWAPFTITEFEEGRYWSWRVHGVQATGHRLIQERSDQCTVIFEVPPAAAPYVFFCALALDRIAKLLATKTSQPPPAPGFAA